MAEVILPAAPKYDLGVNELENEFWIRCPAAGCFEVWSKTTDTYEDFASHVRRHEIAEGLEDGEGDEIAKVLFDGLG